MDFCRKLTEMDRKAGKLPRGYIYSLPTESQWDYLAADATLENAITSEKTSRNGTEVAGTLDSNKFGLYDVRGNVWELTLGQYDANRYAIRGGCWLTSRTSSLDVAYREGVRPDYKDRFIGFRVVLVREP
jgi:formylglycine-generating enzyme required for sulfatase activity